MSEKSSYVSDSNGDETPNGNDASPSNNSTRTVLLAACLLLLLAITALVSSPSVSKPKKSARKVAVAPLFPYELRGRELRSVILYEKEKIEGWSRIIAYLQNAERSEPYVKEWRLKEARKLSLEDNIWQLNEKTGESLYSYGLQFDPKNDKLKKLYERFIETKNKITIERSHRTRDNGPAILVLQDEIQTLQVPLEYEIHNLYAVIRVRLDEANMEYRRAFTVALTQGAFPWKSMKSCGMLITRYEEAQKYLDNDMKRLAELNAMQLRVNAEVSSPVNH